MADQGAQVDVMERMEAMTTGQPAETVLEVRRVRLEELHHDPANARKHGPRNLENIVASLQEFGQVEPLVVQKGTGKVIGGNGRLTAMKSLGYTECDIVEFDGSPVQATALGITLNRSAELASWDNSALADTLRALQEEEFDLEAVGFTDDEVDAMFGDPASSGNVVEDPQGEWQGMPEFENGDESPYRTLNVHFASQEAVADFMARIGQQFTDEAKYIWYPKLKIQRPSSTPYVNES